MREVNDWSEWRGQMTATMAEIQKDISAIFRLMDTRCGEHASRIARLEEAKRHTAGLAVLIGGAIVGIVTVLVEVLLR